MSSGKGERWVFLLFFREGPKASFLGSPLTSERGHGPSQLITDFHKSTLAQFLYASHSLPIQLVYVFGTTNYR